MGDRRNFLAGLLAGAATPLLARMAAAAEPRVAPARGIMAAGQPSRTARSAAVARAMHQAMDFPPVFADRFAIPMVSPVTAAELRAVAEGSPAMRASIAMRSRYAEDRLADAVKRGVRQYVLLGAGLDTFALRNPHATAGLRVFEVDHPATQLLKRERIATARLRPAAGVKFVPVDFETQSLSAQLAKAGFRTRRPAFFSMLGVVIYLTDAAVMETMGMIASCAKGTEVVFSFSVPDEQLGESQRAARRRSMVVLEEIGEPWISFYDPEVLAARLRSAGFSRTELLSPGDANQRYFAGRGDALRISSGFMMLARV